MATVASALPPVKPNIFHDADELLASRLPKIDGTGLTTAEAFRITGAENRARAAYAADCPDADFAECHRVGRLAAADELRRLLKDRPIAPCCDSLEERPCMGCSSHQTDDIVSNDAIPGAEPEMTEEELELLAELNRENPAGAVEANIGRFPAFDVWPDYVSSFYWEPMPIVEPELRLTLAEMVEFTARRFRLLDNGLGDLVGDRLERLAREVRATSASVPDQVDARLSVLDLDFSEAWEMPGEVELNSAGVLV